MRARRQGAGGWRAIAVTVPLLAGCAPEGLSFLTPAGPVAAAERAHLVTVTLIALIVVAPVLIGVPLIAWRYRRRRRAAYAPDWDFSRPLETVMWGVPLIVVAVLGWQLVRATEALDPYRRLDPAAPALRVEAIGLDWNWLFLYPDLGIASLNDLAFPAGQPVSIRLTSDTVMQSFFIGALGSQIYAMPGMETRLNLRADHPGRYEGENTQFSGPGFQHQKFAARSLTADAFDAWVEDVRADGGALDAAAYARLGHDQTPAEAAAAFARPGVPEGVAWFARAEPGLFDRVLSRYMAGAPLPATAQPGSPAYDGTPPPAGMAPMHGSAMPGTHSAPPMAQPDGGGSD